MFLYKALPRNGIIGIDSKCSVSNLYWSSILHIQEANLAHIFKLTTPFTNLYFFVPCIATSSPPEHCEWRCTEFALLIKIRLCLHEGFVPCFDYYGLGFRVLAEKEKERVLEANIVLPTAVNQSPKPIQKQVYEWYEWSHTRGVEKQRTLITTLPLWVKIHNVPKELWTDDGLGFPASKVGVPHSQNEATKLKKRIDYAHVCVEVDVSAKLLDSFPIELAPGDEHLILFEYPWIPVRCKSCQKFGHATENCSRDANSVRRKNINGTGRLNIRTNLQTCLDSNSANRAQEGGQNERISTNTNVSYENIGRNTVIYAGNGSGENKRRRIWRVRSRPTSLSEVAGTSCIRNDRGEEIREHNSCPAAQDEPAKIPTDAGQSVLTEDRTQRTKVTIEMHDSMQMVVHEPQVEELVLVAQPNLFQLLAGEELEGESPHETEYFEDHLYAYEKEKASRDWFTKGDKGTTYFFNCLKERKNRSAIRSLTTHDGVQLNTQDQIVFAWWVYLNTEPNSMLRNNNRQSYYPMLMGVNKDKSNNEVQLTSVACAIHLDNDICEYRRWFVPVVDGNHWWLYVFDPSARKVVILDSLTSSASNIYGGMESMKSMVTKMHFTLSVIGDEYAKKCAVKDWIIEKCQDVP
ncbi:hypothetical protein IFM89_010639 [Coptis chinensis]|uniref:Ubiquitin-like protease family profile domain-containing protein n=1 Tax=Coptis chinensis TaxID=261450 RepID=A0A835IQX6_9MAGN|nr:hypothetical protein IFM89_010639 [Coptis chinensis]